MNRDVADRAATAAEATPREFLMSGSPRFAGVGGVASDDAVAGWRAAVRVLGHRGAAATTAGPYAVGLREADGRGFMAIDRFATETLCYRVVDGELRFATRADELAGTTPALDPQAIFDFLYFHCIPSPRTVFRDVFRLPPGHFAVFEGGRVTVAPYWTPEFVEPTNVSFDELAEEFRALIERAVRRQLGTGKPACFLSGGTDSSTVAGMIGRVAGQSAATYSIGFAAQGYDEMAYARIAAKHFGTSHHEYYVTPEDLVRSIADVATSYDQPFGNSSALPAYYCARMARSDGVTRLLAGDGGDELFGGNSRYATQRIFDAYGVLPEPIRRGIVEPIVGIQALRHLTLWRRGASYVTQARMRMPDRLQQHNLMRRIGVGNVLTPGFLAQIDPDDATCQQREVWDRAHTASTLNRTLAFDWRYTLAESDLPKVRGSAMLAGVQVGFPFLDQDLLEFSMRLPAHYKLNGFRLRWFFKQALRDFLPRAIIAKRKQGFGLPFGVWTTRHEPLKRLAVESLESLASRGIIQPAFIRALVETHLHEHPGYYGEMVWILMTLEQWLRRHSPAFEFRS